MSGHARFHLKTPDDLRSELARLGLSLPTREDLGVLGDKVKVGRCEAPNRFVVQPMEGFDADAEGRPTDLAFRRYRRYAEGGSGLIWFEATAVLHEARSNPGQFWLHGGSYDTFTRLVEATRRTAREKLGREPVLVLQLTHSGRYSKPSGAPEPIIAHRSPVLDPKHGLRADYPVVTDEYLDRLQDTFVETAKLAAGAGFDGVDVKSCHRYLVSELLASHTREGRYGGSYENRTRFLRETLARIKSEVPGVFATTRMNAYDATGFPYGWGVDRNDCREPDLTEPVRLARELAGPGKLGVPVLNVSVGNPYYNPHYGRPYDFPVAGATPPDEHPLEGIVRFIGITRDIQRSIPDTPVVASGYAWLRHHMPHVAAGVITEGWATLIGQGRGAIAYPDSVRDILGKGGMDPRKCCVTCSACTQIMRDGGKTGCVVRDSEIYGPEYRLGRRFAVDRLQAEAARCRDCEFPTCQDGCPARVEVPAFVRAFAEGDFAGAYDVLHQENVLPEMCAYVCPSEVQCEGSCLENIFYGRPLPVRDIQLVTCRIARLKGLTGLRLPDAEAGRRGRWPRRIAVVGGGPAGLACAVRLLELGHRVTIFEKGSSLGGTPGCIIPDARYGGARAEVDAILAPAKEAGRVEIRLGSALGENVRLGELRQGFEAVFLAMGLPKSSSIREGGGEIEGVVDALGFLRGAKCAEIRKLEGRVAVLGGGNTAMDAARQALRLGAREVYLVYRRSFAELPAWPAERDRCLDSGVHLLILQQPVGYVTDDGGRLTGVRIVRTELGEPDDSGRRWPVAVEGTETVLGADTCIEAVGQGLDGDLRSALEAAGIAFADAGLVDLRPASAATSVAGIFAGGDVVNGGTTAVRAVAEGMKAAEEIDAYLSAK
jgi:NADPH-dependent glutamate synthase beta subunit-like oxidoreductase/2,4-dienoyl-CoA reductase-like NADH-dependent reductase (Old Yellow Enzyme family)